LAYIGTKPTIGNFQICDAISVVNGQAAYTMQVGSVNVSPQSANHMIVSLNGTIQKPNSSFTVSGSTITFASNLATGDVIDFIQILGDVLDLGVPSDATVTTAKLASDSVTYEKIGYNANQFRNIIINGSMDISQRGTSFTSVTSNTYTLDRWMTSGSGYTLTITQDTDVPTGQGFTKSAKLQVTTANTSPSAAENLQYQTRFEGQMLQYLKFGTSSAESLTMSFWVKSNLTGVYCTEFQNDDNDKTRGANFTISSANTWEKKTITISGDTASGFTNDNNRSMRLSFGLMSGSNTTGTNASIANWVTRSSNLTSIFPNLGVNFCSSTSNYINIAGVQLEAGQTSSDFEFLPVDVNLSRCQRYYQLWTEGNNKEVDTGFYYTSSSVRWVSSFYKQMRTVPSLVTVSGTDYYGIYSNSALDTFDNFGGINDTSTNQNFQVYASSGVSGTAGYAGMLRTNNASASIAFNAEL
jgi:hypothetical protein